MASAYGGARGKSKIRAPRKGLNNQDVDFEDTWTALSSALREMHTKNASKLSFEVIYRHAYKVVLKKKGDILYDRLQAFETEWLRGEVRNYLRNRIDPILLPSAASTSSSTANERRVAGEKFLGAMRSVFQDHQTVMNMATDVFMYLDRVYCNDKQRPTIYTAAMLQFRDFILREQFQSGLPSMLSTLNQIILEQVRMDREGDVIDKSLVKANVNMLENLFETPAEAEDEKLYLTAFEEDFLETTREFYAAEGARLLEEQDAASYCKNTSRRIHEEIDRCRSTLSEITTLKVTSVLEDELISKRIHALIAMDSGVKYMIDNNRFGDLELVFELNSRIDSEKKELTTAIQNRVMEMGNQINAAAANLTAAQTVTSEAQGGNQDDTKQRPALDRAVNQQTEAAKHWVEQILTLKDQYDHLWKVSFQSDPIIQPALTKSFTETINMFQRSSEYVSLFIDDNMKKTLKDKTEEEVDKVLDKAIVLLRYIQDKDLFERYYKKHLSKRLLMQKSVSIDVEKLMIQRMKIELGNSFTSKMESMFKDMALSEELTASYRTRVTDALDTKRTELAVHILTTTVWPLETMQSSTSEIESRTKCIYPPNIERLKKGFEAFYAERHSGRMLTWMPNMGTADVRAFFPAIPGKEGTALGKDRRYELNVSTYALFILMLFNEIPRGQSLSFDDIQARTNIDTPELVRNLQSLAVAPKSRVLAKEPMSRDVKNTDRFSFNDKFQSQYLRIKVGVVAAGNKVEGEKERKETERKNNDSRGYVIEASVVRIMKQRKEMTHQNLVAETISQLSSKFKPDVTMIKRRIEALIEREYLERIEGAQVPSYRYLA